MKKILQIGPIFVIIAALLWSFDGVLRISLYTLPPSVIVFYEHLLGSLILIFFIAKCIPDFKKMNMKEWIAISVVSLFSGVLGTIFYTSALSQVQYIQYSVVVLLQQQLQPIWAILAASILLKEKITKKYLFWAGVAMIAVYFVTFKDLTVNLSSQGTLVGGLLSLLAGVMWGTSTAISKYALNKVSFLTATSLRFFIASIFGLIFVFGAGNTQALFSLNQNQWLTLLLITFSTGMVALLIYYYGLKKIHAKSSPIYELVWPASAVAIDYFLYHKTLSITQVAGIALLLFAIYNVMRVTKEVKIKQ